MPVLSIAVGKSAGVGVKVKKITPIARTYLNPKTGRQKTFKDTAMQKRTEITIETERLLVISQRQGRVGLWCSRCAGILPMLPVAVASRIVRVTPLEIFRLFEAGRIHFGLSQHGRLFVCPNSPALRQTEESSESDPEITKHFDCK